MAKLERIRSGTRAYAELHRQHRRRSRRQISLGTLGRTGDQGLEAIHLCGRFDVRGLEQTHTRRQVSGGRTRVHERGCCREDGRIGAPSWRRFDFRYDSLLEARRSRGATVLRVPECCVGAGGGTISAAGCENGERQQKSGANSANTTSRHGKPPRETWIRDAEPWRVARGHVSPCAAMSPSDPDDLAHGSLRL